MLTRFFASRTNSQMNAKYFRGFAMHAKIPKKDDNDWDTAIDHIKELYQKKKYEEVLREVSKMEDRFPGCSKMVQHYRGEAGMALLEQSGKLKKLRPSI